MGKIGLLISFCALLHLAEAQTYHHIDTLPTQEAQTHLFLTIESPAGTMRIQSSGVCGQSISKITSQGEQSQPFVSTRHAGHGSILRTIRVTGRTENQAAGMGARMRLARGIAYAPRESYQAHYLSDPNLPTDLSLNLGSGPTQLDLSGLSLRNLTINSALSDLTISYSSPNQIQMKRMDIHAATADITLDHIEYARAKMINIRNDVGNIRIYLGDDYNHATNLMIMSGAGECSLLIHKNHPVKLIIKSGIFSRVSFQGEFAKVTQGIYTNQAYDRHPDRGTTIICETDLGSITVLEQE